MNAPRSPRDRLIRLIHVARRELAMDEPTYRGIVAQHAGGKTSAGDCRVGELEAILAHLKRCGFEIRKPAGAPPVETRPLDMAAESSKARALWLFLHRLGAVKNPAESALAGYVRRQAGVDDLRWATGARAEAVIEGLKAWAARVLPRVLAERLTRLYAQGALATMISVPQLARTAAPRLDPRTFDALRAAWDWLDARHPETAPQEEPHGQSSRQTL